MIFLENCWKTTYKTMKQDFIGTFYELKPNVPWRIVKNYYKCNNWCAIL